MRFFALPALIPLAAFSADKTMLLVWPLDTAVVTIDSSVSSASLLTEKDPEKHPPSPAALIVREFRLAFGSVKGPNLPAHVGIADSSRAHPSVLSPFEVVRAPCPACGGFPSFRMPLAVDADSSRYVLVVGALSFSSRSRSVGRRFIPPSPPGIDPLTGEMTPGLHKGHPEGPGLMTTLTATASWMIWDREKGAAHAIGKDSGTSTFRGDARAGHWREAARDLTAGILGKADLAGMR